MPHVTAIRFALGCGMAALLIGIARPASAWVPLEGIGRVAAGDFHTCALTTAGGVKCWGWNTAGQLGDGTTTDRTTPGDVSGLTSGVAAITAGGLRTCALTTGGGVKCWGSNYSGGIGDGSTTFRPAPVDVSGLASGVIAIAAGVGHTCALTASGGVKCWGPNNNGQLGDGTTTDRLAPVDVPGLASGVAAIVAGSDHTCALTTGGGVRCWGLNGGALGDGTATNRLSPVDVSGLASGVVALAAGGGGYPGGGHTCALTTGGGVKCWGRNAYGQLGDGTTTTRLAPVDVSGLASGVAAIATLGFHTCALTTGGGMKCWGFNRGGRLGDGTITDRLAPVDVSGLSSGVAAIATGAVHTCALTTGGRVKCWGNNYHPLSGLWGTRRAPVQAMGLTSGVAAIAAGSDHTCALTTGGGVKCWGVNYRGQLGDGTADAREAPVDVSGLASGVAAIAAGEAHTCALSTGGAVKCWGYNYSGQIGDGTTFDRSIPVDVPSLASGVSAITAGASHTCAVSTAGGVKCWGSSSGASAPVEVPGLSSGVSAIAAGSSHTCALTTAGGVKCWGDNFDGQLGDGTTTYRFEPVDVSGLASGVMAISAGGRHTCAVTAGGGVKCWGINRAGELGDGTQTNRLTPVNVSGLASGVSAIAAGTDHTCARTSGAGVLCWGSNAWGQVGDDSRVALRMKPVNVTGLASGVAGVAAGWKHSCAVTTGGGVRCWGDNAAYQLGYVDSVPADVLVPGIAITSNTVSGVTNATSATFSFAATVPGSLECSLDGAAFVACTSPRTYTGLAPGAHTFEVRSPLSEAAAHNWEIVTSLFSAGPGIDFGAQAATTRSRARTVTLTNSSGSPVTVGGAYMSSDEFAQAGTTCTTIPAGGTCEWSVTFAPRTLGPVAGSLVVYYAGGTTVVALSGVGERSLVTHYYRSILAREPDAGGRAFWEAEAARVVGLGGNVTEVWLAMVQQFFTSAEYAAFNRGNTGFVTDLYATFFNRAPDGGGLAFWVGQVDQGMPREVVLASFMFSAEFANFTTVIFGNVGARAEVNSVVDFYRGLLARTPDDGGFGYWVGRFRTAQCSGAAAIVAEVEAISGAFVNSGEYAARGRTNAQYVGDLYNAFLRRGGDLGGVQFWIDQITTGARTREQVRIEFKNSPEFQARVNAIIAQGCLQ